MQIVDGIELIRVLRPLEVSTLILQILAYFYCRIWPQKVIFYHFWGFADLVLLEQEFIIGTLFLVKQGL